MGLKDFIDNVKEEVEYQLWCKRYENEKNRISRLCKNHFIPYPKRIKEEYTIWCLDRGDDGVEDGDLLYILDDYIRSGLCYEFKVNGAYCHQHDFESLLVSIRTFVLENNATVTFDECEEDYSKQELELLHKFVKKLEEDRLKDDFTFNADNLKG